MTTRVIGERVVRKEDPALLSGSGQFLDDVEPAGRLHAAVVRVEHANARITGIDTGVAEGMSGVIAIYTHAELGELVLGRKSGRR